MRFPLLLILAVSAAGVSSCGRLAPLQPAAGEPLPVKPLMAQSTPTPEELLNAPTYADPNRVDELMRRSTPRKSDRFDLPPPAGGAVPLPIGGEEETSSEELGPATPDD